MGMLINKKAVKKFALGKASARTWKFERVSSKFLEDCDSHLRNYITNKIYYLPSKGKTL